MKITFMGAGSTVFAKNVLGDVLLTPALNENLEIALYDIDSDRLDESRMVIEALNKKYNCGKAKISAYLGVESRKNALRGAKFVVNAIQVGLYDPCTIIDFEIPKKYGLRQTIGDTLGIGGIFRGLRTIHVLKGFAHDMEEVCPNAWFLNYTNPMAMLTGAMLSIKVNMSFTVAMLYPPLARCGQPPAAPIPQGRLPSVGLHDHHGRGWHGVD